MTELKNITKKYGDKTVFRDLSYVFEDKIYAIMGQSGCGKTTLLRCVSSLTPLTSGKIKNSSEKTAFVFSDARLFGELSALDNITAVGAKRDAAKKLLESFGLEHDMNTPVKYFSDGMAQRVAIARALAYDAGTILLDEPFSKLDKSRKNAVMEITKTYCKDKCVLFVTHNIEEARNFADKILLLENNSLNTVN